MEAKKEQSREEMQGNIRRSSNRKILRRQMELLAEYCRANYDSNCPIPASSEAMVSVHRELVKAEDRTFLRIFIVLFGLCYFFKGFVVKAAKLIQR